ncbi:hypothetical protein GO755_27670 [Spirosoma sp. HMF4905]|uniref:ZU5 domain-containing protein n=1 Tax=Spirosoma arboris TaxID=2682092 RepID=A0A7K1SJT5_9BACT|nr:hypothetical protein [Spirosoma arboris]MVM33846.1 hypothetical protein [Spirosoma arboris]
MKRFLYVPLFFFVGLLACQKATEAVNPVNTNKPSDTTTHTSPTHSGVVYEHGTPVGQPTQKTIGPQGGTMTSADGTLAMTIPAGAVSKATTFTMQPVKPTLPGLIGEQSFRLLPEGQTFAQPITLQYHYDADSLDGTSAQALFMAYQDSDGYWNALPKTALDETAQTLTVSTKHFSDWGAFAEYMLTASPDVIFPAQSSTLDIVGYGDDFSQPLHELDDAVKLAHQKTLEDPANIKNWRYAGSSGTLEVAKARTSATFWPSESVAKGKTVIKVDIYNIIPAEQSPRGSATGKVELLKTIRIEGAYFRATVNGKSSEGKVWHGLVTANQTSIGGLLVSGDYIDLAIGQTDLHPGRIAYAGDDATNLASTGNALATLEIDGDLTREYVSWYSPCEGEHLIPSSGYITIDEVKEFYGVTYVRGSFEVTTYWEEGECPDVKLDKKTISGEFRVQLKKK